MAFLLLETEFRKSPGNYRSRLSRPRWPNALWTKESTIQIVYLMISTLAGAAPSGQKGSEHGIKPRDSSRLPVLEIVPTMKYVLCRVVFKHPLRQGVEQMEQSSLANTLYLTPLTFQAITNAGLLQTTDDDRHGHHRSRNKSFGSVPKTNIFPQPCVDRSIRVLPEISIHQPRGRLRLHVLPANRHDPSRPKPKESLRRRDMGDLHPSLHPRSHHGHLHVLYVNLHYDTLSLENLFTGEISQVLIQTDRAAVTEGSVAHVLQARREFALPWCGGASPL